MPLRANVPSLTFIGPVTWPRSFNLDWYPEFSPDKRRSSYLQPMQYRQNCRGLRVSLKFGQILRLTFDRKATIPVNAISEFGSTAKGDSPQFGRDSLIALVSPKLYFEPDQGTGKRPVITSQRGIGAAHRLASQAGETDSDGNTWLVQQAIERAKAGDSEGLHFLYVRYAPDVQRYITSFVKDHHEAEDITQNVFAKLMKAIHKYEQRDVPFAAWIMRVSRNAALDHMRSRRATPAEEVRLADDGHARNQQRSES